jgi:uncharacterized protein YciI
MKHALALIAFLSLCLPTAAQQQEPQHKLVQFQMAILKRGPKPMPADWETSSLRERHVAYVQSLVQSGKAMIAGRIKDDPEMAEMKKLVVAGPFGDDGTLRGIFVFRVNSLEEARSLAQTDPAVQAGRLALQIHPWVVPEGILP